jgi:acyl-CoA reductase-like NAD-dependent aldehyde dehydrogenase
MNMLIDSQWVEASDGAWREVHNPGNGEVIDKVPEATLEDAQKAVDAAQYGQTLMSKTPAHQRADYLFKTADAIENNKSMLSELLAKENGKPIFQTREEVAVTARIFRGYAEQAKRILGRLFPMDAIPGQEHNLAFTIRQPLGVIAAIIPFNYPVELWAHKAAAALAAGNACIVKPPSDCPLTLLKIAELMQKVGLPQAAYQVITGPGSRIGEFLASSPGVQMVTVTGSTPVGIKISELAAKNLKKTCLELGGNDATIVCADADLDKAALAVVLGRLARGNGQICCAVKRIFVDASVYEEFVEILVAKSQKLKLGDQLSEDTDVGPLINERAAIKVEELIQDAISAGAVLSSGGHRKGAFIEPTVLTNVTTEVELFREETFGPVAPLVAFTDLEDAIEMANDTPFGLQAAVFTHDITKAFDIAYRLKTGGVIINWSSATRVESLPFGGVKLSGNCREGFLDTVNMMTEEKIILIHGATSVMDAE